MGDLLFFFPFVSRCFCFGGTEFAESTRSIRRKGQGTLSLVGRGVKPHKRCPFLQYPGCIAFGRRCHTRSLIFRLSLGNHTSARFCFSGTLFAESAIHFRYWVQGR